MTDCDCKTCQMVGKVRDAIEDLDKPKENRRHSGGLGNISKAPKLKRTNGTTRVRNGSPIPKNWKRYGG